MGTPYIWGAEGPDAFDCSGFAKWALSLLNLDPAGDQTADGLYRFYKRNRSTSVSVEESRMGDIVFFGTDDAVTHIGLAWDDGNMLEAGGGGRRTTNVDMARQQHAEVRIRRIGSRLDLVEILRPSALVWVDGATIESILGRYENAPPVAQWLGDGRNMRLTEPFGYVDGDGRPWPVPVGAVVDGASIPRVFWSLIGGPFEGLYRDASVVHDYYCDVRTRSWQDTHQVFHEAMLTSGVSSVKAKIMYYAVYRFGPRWTLVEPATAPGFEAVFEAAVVPTDLAVEPFDAASFEADAQIIASTQLGVHEIKAMADARARASSIGDVS